VELTAGEARYLLAIHRMRDTGRKPTQAALARRLGVSGPTALEMVRRLRQVELVAPDGLELLPAGVSAALVLSSRRRAAEALAHDVLGLDHEQAAIEADRLAASASPALARRLVAWGAAHRTAAG
jgi:DtxR family transcriptional regulator, Mn-dependent transcriptional regulator